MPSPSSEPLSYICPSCGAEVQVGAAGCPRCRPRSVWGKSSGKKGDPHRSSPKEWEQDEVYDGVDVPEDDFDYDDFVKREFGNGGEQKGSRLHWGWRTVAAILLIALIVSWFVYAKLHPGVTNPPPFDTMETFKQ